MLKQQGAVLIGHEVYTHSTEAVDNITASRLVNAANFFSPNMLEARCLLQSVAAAEEGKPWQSPPSLPAEVCLGSALDLASDLSRRFGNQNVLLRWASFASPKEHLLR